MKFREREIVRVVAEGPAVGQPTPGVEGVVDSFSDRPKGVFVRVPDEAGKGDTLWFFTEDELEETGWIEVDRATGERVSFDPGTSGALDDDEEPEGLEGHLHPRRRAS